MRKAAGIILLSLVVFGLVTTVIDVRVLIVIVSVRIVGGGFLVAAGVLCLKRKYWGLCLAPALFALLTGISSVVEPLLRGDFPTSWQTWIWVIGALISTIFISLAKKEWQKPQALPDSPTS
jgi:hypothetical protein